MNANRLERRRSLIVCTIMLACAFHSPHAFASAPLSLDQVVERYIAAIGGSAAIAKINTLTYTTVMPNGNTRRMIKMRPYYFLVGCTEPKCAIAEGFDGAAWEASPQHNRVIRARLEAAKSLRRASEFDPPLVGWREKGHRAELKGLEEFNGRRAYRIDLTLNDGLDTSNFIDAETFLLIGSRAAVPMHSRGEHYETINIFEDYRSVAGVQYPFRVRTLDASTGKLVSGGRGWDRIEANIPYDVSMFSPPCLKPQPITALAEYLLSISGSVSPPEQWFRPYGAFRSDPANANVSTENDLNWLGYELLKQNAIEDALIVFRTETTEYPNSANAFDSFGDALYAADRIQQAIAAYARAVNLNPKASDSRSKMEELRERGKLPPKY